MELSTTALKMSQNALRDKIVSLNTQQDKDNLSESLKMIYQMALDEVTQALETKQNGK